MISAVEVFLWGTRIGVLYERNSSYYFQYDRSFLNSGIELSPFKMPLSDNVYTFPDLKSVQAFRGLPGLLADSLPDNFGNAVIEQWLISQNRNPDSFSPIERLCYTGTRGMGGLEYVPSIGPSVMNTSVDVDAIAEFAMKVLEAKGNIELKLEDSTIAQLIEVGSSVGGAKAKATLAWNRNTGEIKSGQIDAGDGFDYWIFKFDGGKGYSQIEFAYYLMAQDLDINMQECLLIEMEGGYHFATKRFDRVNNQKVHTQTLGALTHLDYNTPNCCSYEYYGACAKKLNCGKSDIEQIFRRMVFSVMGMNNDDHVKNFSFLMDRRGTWSVSPAYDICYAYKENNPWIKQHQMSINGKSTLITEQDLIACGKSFGLSADFCKRVIEQTTLVVSKWLEYADKSKVQEEKATQIQDNLKTELYRELYSVGGKQFDDHIINDEVKLLFSSSVSGYDANRYDHAIVIYDKDNDEVFRTEDPEELSNIVDEEDLKEYLKAYCHDIKNRDDPR